MKLLVLSKKLRPRWVPQDAAGNLDALATGSSDSVAGPVDAPTNWVPSQQDERPRY